MKSYFKNLLNRTLKVLHIILLLVIILLSMMTLLCIPIYIFTDVFVPTFLFEKIDKLIE